MAKFEMKSMHSDVLAVSQMKPVVVQFYAEWCGPCKVLKPIMEDLFGRADGAWELVYLNVEKDPGLAAQYGVKSIPTVIMFHNEEPIAQFVGSKSPHIIQNWIDSNMPAQSTGEDNAYSDIDHALRIGNLDEAKNCLVERVMEIYKDAPLLKLLSAINAVGSDNNLAKTIINQIDEDSSLNHLIKKVKDIIDIDNDEKSMHTPTSSPYHARSTDVFRKIDIEAFDFDLLSGLVHLGINDARNKKGAVDLKPHSILQGAALDHNNYQIKNNELTHYQNIPAAKTVKERIEKFGGGFMSMGENVQYQGLQVRIMGNTKQFITKTYQETAQDLVTNWINSPGHYRNLINPKFKYVGTAIGWNPINASIFATQVFGA